MNKLIKDANKSPFSHIVIITLFSVGLFSVPLNSLLDLFMGTKASLFLGSAIMRFIVTALAIVFIMKYGFSQQFKGLKSKKSLSILIPALLVAINNAPIVGLLSENVFIYEEPVNVALYLVYCIFVGLAEEFVFRGLIFPLCLKITGDKKLGAFWAIALNATIFALSHLVNLLNGYSVGAVALQVGYTFLIGALCAIVFAVTKNIFTAVIIHVVYDVGGLMMGNIATGNQWDSLTIILTAVLGVIVCAYMVFVAIKLNGKQLKEQYFIEEEHEIKSEVKAD